MFDNFRRNFGSNQTAIINNGQVINGSSSHEKVTFDERVQKNAEMVDSIFVDSTVADVKFFSKKTTDVEVHFYGSANISGKVDFNVKLVDGELRVKFNIQGNCFNGNFNIDIFVPSYKEFDTISVKTTSADCALEKEIASDVIKFESMSGDIQTDATFEKTFINTMSGDVEVSVTANNDITMQIETMSGDIDVDMKNIKTLDLALRTLSGTVRNQHENIIEGFMAKGGISSMSGRIRIK